VIEQDVAELMEAGKPAEALKILISALRESESGGLWNDWGSVAFAGGDPALAEEGFRRALQLDPSHRQATINLTALLLGQGRLEETIPLFQSLAGRLTEEEGRALRQLEAGGKGAVLPNAAIAAASLSGSARSAEPAAGRRESGHVQIVIVKPNGYKHSEAFVEVAETLRLGLKAVGFDAQIEWNSFDPGAVNVVLGWHLLNKAQLRALPLYCILYNLEQLDEKNNSLRGRLKRLAGQCEIWDYSLRNIEILHESGYSGVLHHVPIGTMPALARISSAPQQDIDVLFYGSINARRATIIEALKIKGLVVRTVFGVYGADRDALIARAKVVLNLHYYDTSIFEIVRVSYLWINRKAVVSECHDATELEETLRGAARFVPYDQLVSACQELVTQSSVRQALEQSAFEVMSARGEVGILRRVLQRETEAPHETCQLNRLCHQGASIIIPTWNKLEFTRRCVTKLLENTPESLYEIIFVDNGSTDGTAEFLATLNGNVRVITNSENLGFLDASNQGACISRRRYLVFLNNDTVPQSGWLEALMETAGEDPNVGAVGAKLVYPDGRLQEAGGIIFQDASGWNFGRFGDPLASGHNKQCEVDYCSAAALLIRRDVFEKLGGFDRQFAPAYYEDTDICFGVRSIGLKVMYCPNATVTHFEGITAGTDLRAGFKRFQAINRKKFALKWAEALAKQDESPAITHREPSTADRSRLGSLVSAQMRQTDAPFVRPPMEQGIPHILVIDPFLPLYDRASGSLRLFCIVKIFRALGCRVTYIARDGYGQERYRKALEALGVIVYATDPIKMAQLGYARDAPRIDLARILSERPCDIAWLSFYDVAEQYLPDIRRLSPNTTIVVDTVDVHFLREARQAKLERDREGARKRAEKTRKREMAIYGEADLVVTVTPADGDALRAEGLQSPMGVIPNVHEAVGITSAWKARRDLIFVGNFNHSPNIDAVLWFCQEIMPRIQTALPDVKVNIVGTNPPPEIKSLLGSGIAVLGWVPDTAPYLDSARVSIAPLRVGAGMKGKVGEALSRGLPVVTTSIGAEGMGLQNGKNVIIADDPVTFARAVVRLYQDQVMWEHMADAGRELVEQKYGTSSVMHLLRNLLRKNLARTEGELQNGESGIASFGAKRELTM
jgi:GT2 family glycosyltransferase/glycosyltransferase involved in cell wall biosynthesis